MKLLVLITLFVALPSSAFAGCPNLSGSYVVISTSSADNGNQTPTGATITISQSGCHEVDVTTASAGAPQASQQKYIIDGQPHPWSDISDVGVSFVVTAQFQGNALVGTMGMTSMPNTTIGTIGYSLDSSGKTLTFSMTTQGGAFSATATRQ